MSDTRRQGRNFLRTINNTTETPKQIQKVCNEHKLQYAFQLKKEESGTEHYQEVDSNLQVVPKSKGRIRKEPKNSKTILPKE
ncbi:hypothetical protein P879_09907 [Paragonimus westermani]|uniref:Uncharacterized protein n=1 Tax=Paragonimus westermani TaxID=34504 RepID=A0A8T0D8R0_9TREM|nr:hypothetical protein P879_09907 [Paragonimus westermani]